MRRTVALLVGFAISALPSAASAQDPAAFYQDNCAFCHTIGGGPQGGPDLEGVTKRRDREWLIRFLVDTDAFASDPAVLRMVEEAGGLKMPPTPGMTRQLAEALLVLIEQQSGADVAIAPVAARAMTTPEDVARGRVLFLGTARLAGSGPACVACHDAPGLPQPGGGRLGPDLSAAHERFGGAHGLSAWLGAMPTPMMRALYRDAPLEADEPHALAAFFEDAAAQPPPQAGAVPGFVIAGAAGAAAVLLIAGLAWARRFRAVRRPMVERGAPARSDVRHAPGAAALAAAGGVPATGSNVPGGPR
jgi:mono/diheme cytochrome c family protein